MGEVFNQGLLITAVGMALVFVMIIILWGIMALLVKLTNRKEADDGEGDSGEESPVVAIESLAESDDQAALAAAIAVAYAMETESSLAFKSQPGISGSGENAWLTAGRAQQLYSNTIRGRNR